MLCICRLDVNSFWVWFYNGWMDKCVTGHAKKSQSNSQAWQTKRCLLFNAWKKIWIWFSEMSFRKDIDIARAYGNKNISQLQWVSQPNQTSTDAILMKRMSYDGKQTCKKVAVISVSTAIHQQYWKDATKKHLITQGSKHLRQLKQRIGIWHSEFSMEWTTKVIIPLNNLWKYSCSRKTTRIKFDWEMEREKRKIKPPPAGSCPCDLLRTSLRYASRLLFLALGLLSYPCCHNGARRSEAPFPASSLCVWYHALNTRSTVSTHCLFWIK